MIFLSQWSSQVWHLLIDVAPWLLAGFLLAGVVHVLVLIEKLSRHLGAGKRFGVLKATLVGIPLPLCSCSVIPVASMLRRLGAGKGATAGFLISTPETGVDSIAVSYALLGPFLAVARPVSAFITSIVAGGLIEVLERREDPKDKPIEKDDGEVSACAGACSCDEPDTGNIAKRSRFATAIRFSLVDMFVDLSHWLAIGFLLAGLISAAIPEGFIGGQLGSGLGTMLLMLVVGLPMYVCATSSTPIAAALIAAGLSPGAALVFLLAGPASNVATMGVIARELGRTSLVCYIASIAVVSILCGYATDAVLTLWPQTNIPAANASHDALPWWSIPCAVALVVLMVNGLRIRWKHKSE